MSDPIIHRNNDITIDGEYIGRVTKTPNGWQARDAQDGHVTFALTRRDAVAQLRDWTA